MTGRHGMFAERSSQCYELKAGWKLKDVITA